MFFFEKKNQKTFANWASFYPDRAQQKQSKVFCFFFSKKNALLLPVNQIAYFRAPPKSA
jgi:hypothetical protein